MLWDLDWDLIDKYGFNRNLYAAWNTAGNTRALQYVMDGLKLQGCNPGLVVARDAIIAGAKVRNDGDADTCTIWATFARRGLGYSAVQGTTNRKLSAAEQTEAYREARRLQMGAYADKRRYLSDPPIEYRRLPEEAQADLGEPEKQKERRRKKEAKAAKQSSWWPF